MFVIKRVRVTKNRAGQEIHGFGYWNARLLRFGAEPFATPFSAEQAEAVKKNLIRNFISWRNSEDWIEIQKVNPEVKHLIGPADVPQFERD